MLDQLVSAATTALVGAMATDAWQVARAGFARLFGQGDRRREELAAARLGGAAESVERAAGEAQNRVRQELVPVWEVRLRDLLEDYPEVEEELRALADEVRAQLSPAHQTWLQHNVARDYGTVIASQGGTQHVHLKSHTPSEAAEDKSLAC